MIKTKVVATVGPASANPQVMTGLVRAGVNVARINMSHGTHETHARSIRLVREAAKAVGRPVAVMTDLQGPKIRIGDLDEPVLLRDGHSVAFAPEGSHWSGDLPTAYAALARDVTPGTRMLLDDGLIELVCTWTDGERAEFEVARGGLLHSRKGINLPGVEVDTPSITEKDLRDLEFALAMDADYVGLSFVRKMSDVEELQGILKGRAWLVAKIEKAQAMDQLDGILAKCDAVMVARGDLGVELPFAAVPLAQKRIIQAANGWGRPVVTATQMLESMTAYPRPTRAEASDVANAILDGTDAVMLSGETAVGKYPVRTVEVMVRVAEEVEESGALAEGPHYLHHAGPVQRRGSSQTEHAVAGSTVRSARDLKAPGIIVLTRSGFFRPPRVVVPSASSHLHGVHRSQGPPPAGRRVGRAARLGHGRRDQLREPDRAGQAGGSRRGRGEAGRPGGRDLGAALPQPRLDQHHEDRAALTCDSPSLGQERPSAFR